MKYKTCIIIMVMAIFLFGISSVCAGDANETIMASENDIEIGQTTDDVIGAVEETNLASSDENEILSVGEQTFTLLNDTINGNTNKTIYLNGNYKYSDTDDSFKKGIVIDRDVNIYGNGSIIDGSKQARIFNITGGNVVFYNITFINGNAGIWDDGGAIHGNCKVINCTFKQNQAQYGYGGAMYYGSAVDCTFTENQAYDGGGAMYKGSAVNSTFNLNSAGGSGGAMYYGSAVNCNFTENTATIDGGAMYKGSAVDCNFYGNAAGNYGNAMFLVYMWNCTDQDYDGYAMHLVLQWEANNFTTSYGSVEKLTIQLKNEDDFLVDFINYDVVIYKSEAYVKTYHCLSNDELSLDLLPGIYIAKLMVTYPGLDNTKPTNITLTVTDGTTFFDLNKAINDNTNDTITLDRDYVFNSTVDSAFRDGIVIDRPVTINGNGYTIDAQDKSRIFKVTADNVTLKNITFKNGNCTGNGGAIYFSGSGTVENCNFTENKATGTPGGGGGAVYFFQQGTVTNCNFTNNQVTGDYSGGGAVFFFLQGNVSNCTFTGNTATGEFCWSGAVFIGWGTVSNCNFTNNQATGSDGRGGAVFSNIQTNVSNCNFRGNTANMYGGAVFFNNNGTVSNCNFTNNQATGIYSYGGGVYFGYQGNVTNCNFTNNTAQYGGAIEMGWGTVSNCNFTNNQATGIYSYGGGVYFILQGNVTNCNFINNNASAGGAIYFNKQNDGLINGSIFINNTKNIIFVESGGNITTINSWFGNNATNYNIRPEAGNVTMNNWLFLNATADSDAIPVFNSTGIVFKLFIYNATSQNVSEYNNTLLLPIDSTIASTNGYVDNPTANLGHSIRYASTRAGEGSVTAKIENVVCTIEFNIDQINPELSVPNQVITYGENATIALNYNTNATGKVNITLTGKKSTLTYLNLDLNATLVLPNDISADEYDVSVLYSGDENFLNATANATLKVNRANSTLTINDIAFDYGTKGSTTVSFTNASGVVAEVIGQPKDIVNVAQNTITVSGLDAGNYTLSVTTITDGNHNSVTKTADITVNKTKTQLVADAITATYNINKDLVITLKDANGNPVAGVDVSVDLNGVKNYVTDASGQAKVSTAGLAPKTYTAKITFAGNTNYLGSSAEVKVVINKATPKITAKKKTYKAKKKTKKFTITLKDNTGKPIKNAKVRLMVKKIAKKSKKKSSKKKSDKKKNYAKTNSKGKATFKVLKNRKGKYTAKVKFYGDQYYNKATKTVKIVLK